MHFSTLLKDELSRRREQNPDYSARAMARDLGLSPGFFVQLLSGKRNLSQEKAHYVAEKMAWPQALRIDFLNLVRAQAIKDPALKKIALKEVSKQKVGRPRFSSVSIDQFKVIAEWYHFAIVELTLIPAFKSEPAWIARRLGLPLQTAKDAIQRLLKIGLLKQNSDGRLVKNATNYSVGDVPSQAIRSFHQQMLSKAAASLSRQDMATRDFSGITMVIDPKRIPKAKKMIAGFRRELMEYLEGGGSSRLYHFSLQLFSLEDNL